MTIKDIECCPFCGCTIFFVREYVKGPIRVKFFANGDEAKNPEMYDGITCYQKKADNFIFCDECERKLAYGDSEELTKSTEKKLKTIRR